MNKLFLPALLFTLSAMGQTLPTLPQATVDVTMPTQSGTVRNVTAGSASDLQTKINAATCGDTIVIPANNTYTGNFSIPNQGACSGWILVKSSALASLPASGTRVSGACSGSGLTTSCPPPSGGTIANMATLSSSSANSSTITFAQSAHNWRFIGLEVTQTAGLHDFSLIETDNNVPTVGQLVSNVIFDRCYIHGTASGAVRRGISFQVVSGAVVDSDIREIHDQSTSPGFGSDSQAIGVWNSPGPMLFQNNLLSAASENTMFGGVDPSITNLVPSDITIVGNHYWKDYTAWFGNGFVVKNIFELKNAQRILVDGNVFEVHWVDAQPGPAITITVRNQSGGCTWCVVQDLTFTHNLVQHVPVGLETTPSDDAHISLPENRILIQNVVFNDVGTGLEIFSGNGVTLAKTSSNITIDHNDVFSSGNILVSGDSGIVDTVGFTNMLGLEGNFTFGGAGHYGDPAGVFNTFFSPYTFNDLLVITTNGLSDGKGYPSGTKFFDSLAGTGFTSVSGSIPNLSGNLQLTSGSAYHNAGTDGKDIGVWDWAAYNNSITNALAGVWQSQTPTAPTGLFAIVSQREMPRLF